VSKISGRWESNPSPKFGAILSLTSVRRHANRIENPRSLSNISNNWFEERLCEVHSSGPECLIRQQRKGAGNDGSRFSAPTRTRRTGVRLFSQRPH